MKRLTIYILITVMFSLWIGGCSETQPDLLEKVLFSEDDNWLDRDYSDPYELVEGQCCNDFTPNPLPIDSTTDRAEIAPAGDLDYFDLQVTGSFAGQLFLTSEKDNVALRLFSRELDEYEFKLDTLYSSSSSGVEPVYWTVLYGSDTTFTLLVKGDSRRAQGGYSLGWQRVIPVVGLDLSSPIQGAHWERSSTHRIHWTIDRIDAVSVALLKGPVVIQMLKRDIVFVQDLWWTPDTDLEQGDDYRIMVFLSDDPTTMDISDAFTIN